ncbi:hypothetical protein [Kaistella montana]|uniref:HTH araC/xylS-type domain-containing protein n=1 Tax=Kaistella montana TaxID=1849733 RepID=A0ABW5K831_9FLAO|nr:hypothetical protein [Kaistella montana]MCQ4035288.1 hypothetical protein [Kaistella montana]
MKQKLIMDAVDVHVVTRYSLGHCRRIIRKIKDINHKLKHQKVTVEEVSDYLGLKPEEIRELFQKTG